MSVCVLTVLMNSSGQVTPVQCAGPALSGSCQHMCPSARQCCSVGYSCDRSSLIILWSLQMAGLEGFPPGPSLYWDQKTPTFVEGDPRRPTTLDRKGKKVIKGYQPEEIVDAGDGESDKYAGMGIGVTGLLAENLACHPFVILRRQCQVNVESRR